MSKKNKRKMEENTEKKAPEMEQEVQNEVKDEATAEAAATTETTAEENATSAAEEAATPTDSQANLAQEVETLTARVAELEDKNLRMMAEFDNYRRRTNKEKLALMETAGEKSLRRCWRWWTTLSARRRLCRRRRILIACGRALS